MRSKVTPAEADAQIAQLRQRLETEIAILRDHQEAMATLLITLGERVIADAAPSVPHLKLVK